MAAKKSENKFASIMEATNSEEKTTAYTDQIKIPKELNNALHFLFKAAGYKSKQEFLFEAAKETIKKKHKDLLVQYNLDL